MHISLSGWFYLLVIFYKIGEELILELKTKEIYGLISFYRTLHVICIKLTKIVILY